ncbi:hypothetical protein E2562_011013 [Oryza meyeriana var. granulata]|uniref:Uncharacterized protein n=1 Tax=Oryza meyeriana var. granulata TaxID=110450 RepID=A0A6G1BW23_9ORYZ|nr:hypothetical protein E2562_011013 [Oryza meyeriana var. granulata]
MNVSHCSLAGSLGPSPDVKNKTKSSLAPAPQGPITQSGPCKDEGRRMASMATSGMATADKTTQRWLMAWERTTSG